MTFASKRFDNRLKRFRALVVALTIILFSIVAHGQQTSTRDKTQSTSPKPVPSPSQSSGKRRIQAVRITEALRIDGLLDEAAWSSAPPATDFLQQQPNEGAAASERTEVRVLFDDKNIHFGIRAFDSDAKHINARELVRDADFSNDDCRNCARHLSRSPQCFPFHRQSARHSAGML
jgi:hypothetical protein